MTSRRRSARWKRALWRLPRSTLQPERLAPVASRPLAFTPTWFQVFPGVDLQAPVTYARGLSGNAATIFGGNQLAVLPEAQGLKDCV